MNVGASSIMLTISARITVVESKLAISRDISLDCTEHVDGPFVELWHETEEFDVVDQ
jgi:hypothetical protein